MTRYAENVLLKAADRLLDLSHDLAAASDMREQDDAAHEVTIFIKDLRSITAVLDELCEMLKSPAARPAARPASTGQCR